MHSHENEGAGLKYSYLNRPEMDFRFHAKSVKTSKFYRHEHHPHYGLCPAETQITISFKMALSISRIANITLPEWNSQWPIGFCVICADSAISALAAERASQEMQRTLRSHFADLRRMHGRSQLTLLSRLAADPFQYERHSSAPGPIVSPIPAG
jgi:hypothetical protein